MSVFLRGVPALPDSSLSTAAFFIFRIFENTKTCLFSYLFSSWICCVLYWHNAGAPYIAETDGDKNEIGFITQQHMKDIMITASLFHLDSPSLDTYAARSARWFLISLFRFIFLSCNCETACFPQVACCVWFSVFFFRLWVSPVSDLPSPFLLAVLMSALLWGAAANRDLFTHLSVHRAEFT